MDFISQSKKGDDDDKERWPRNAPTGDDTPLDDLDQLIVIRNGSIVDSIFINSDQIYYYQNSPIPGYFYNYQFYLIDNEFPINESLMTNSVELFIGDAPL